MLSEAVAFKPASLCEQATADGLARPDARVQAAGPPARAVVREALASLLREVAASGYRFITPTPLTHRRRLSQRRLEVTGGLRDALGWNLPFVPSMLPDPVLTALSSAGMLATEGALARSMLRIASLGNDLFLHSAYPTTQEDAVFFGPDTYRFARFIAQCLQRHAAPSGACRLLDIGCGSGAGAIAAVRALAHLQDAAAPGVEVVLNDINPLALAFAAVNAAHAGVPARLAAGDGLSSVDGLFDLIISNPPYMDDGAKRAYRHGGDGLGRALSLRIATEALARLAPGGSLLLYTGVAIIDGDDPLLASLKPLLDDADCTWDYAEIDPDVFGEELEQPQYAEAERIAAVGLRVTRDMHT